jgi:hypothetical protein
VLPFEYLRKYAYFTIQNRRWISVSVTRAERNGKQATI